MVKKSGIVNGEKTLKTLNRIQLILFPKNLLGKFKDHCIKQYIKNI